MSDVKPVKEKIKKSKTDLFRFATLRSPQLISKENRKLGFVENTQFGKSFFLKEIISEKNMKAAHQKLMAVAPNFTPFASVEEVKDFAGDLWEFSMWLGKNKNNLSDVTRLTASKQGITVPVVANQTKIWDNVFYDILTTKNPYVRQACLQLLVTIHFLEHYSAHQNDTETLKRIAKSRVVVSAAFSRKSTEGNGMMQSSTPKSLEKRALKSQDRVHHYLITGEELKELENIREELTELEDRYTEDYQKAFDKAGANFNKETEAKVEKFQKSAKFDVSDEENRPQLPDDVMGQFEFDYPAPLSRTYTSRKLSSEAKAFVEKNRLENGSIRQAIAKIDEVSVRVQKSANKQIGGQSKSMIIGGIKLKAQTAYVPTYTLGTRFKQVSSGYEMEVYLSFNAGYPNALFQSADFIIQLAGSLTNSYTVDQNDIVLIPSNQPNTVFALLKVISLTSTQYRKVKEAFISLKGSFELDNDKGYSLNSKRTSVFRGMNGIAIEDLVGEDLPTDDIVHYGINKIGIADYRKVEQELCCYIPGEVSHIENVLAREYKERATRHLVRSEDILESTIETEVEELNDTTSTMKNEVSSEIATVLDRDRSMGIGFSTGASGTYFGATFHADMNGDFSYAQSSSESDTIARNYAEDITRRALEKIVQKNTLKRTSKILKEFEDNNKHGYDNRKGKQHVTGVFRWIDKIYKNQLVNYGKRLTYEFMLPEPARFYKDLILIEAEDQTNPGSGSSTGGGTTPVAPIHPKDLDQPINGPSDIDRGNFESLGAFYGITIPVPQKAQEVIQKSYAHVVSNNLGQQQTTNFQNPIAIPMDYECNRLEHDLTIDIFREWFTDNHWRVTANTTQTRTFERPPTYKNGNVLRSYNLTLPGLTGMINASVTSTRCRKVNVDLTAICDLKASVYQQWQQDAYAAIMSAYQQQLDAYNMAVNANNNSSTVDDAAAEEDQLLKTNPKYTKQFIINELKRLCIEMMLKPFGLPQGKEFYVNGPCDVPQLDLGKGLDSYARQVKFFEQAFDWTILSNIFYPYYWGKKCDWKDLFQSQDDTDHILQAFLQSGMGRVLVPVREGFEDAVIYFMETGEIWHGTGLVLDTDDELYLSIVDEIMHLDGEVEEEWETIVPTSLTIVQGKSAYLDDEGLPCCHDDKPEGKVIADANILEILEDEK